MTVLAPVVMGNEVPGGMEAQHCHNYNNENISDRKQVKMCVCVCVCVVGSY